MNKCQNYGCNGDAYKHVLLSNGKKQLRCKVCYMRRIAASRVKNG